MKAIYLPPALILFLLFTFSVVDPINQVAGLIGQGNSREIAKLFAPNVEIGVLDEANMYSKTQAEVILDKFFNQNKPQSVKLLHKVNSNPRYRFGVLILTANTGIFRVSYTLSEEKGGFALMELRIEREKVR